LRSAYAYAFACYSSSVECEGGFVPSTSPIVSLSTTWLGRGLGTQRVLRKSTFFSTFSSTLFQDSQHWKNHVFQMYCRTMHLFSIRRRRGLRNWEHFPTIWTWTCLLHTGSHKQGTRKKHTTYLLQKASATLELNSDTKVFASIGEKYGNAHLGAQGAWCILHPSARLGSSSSLQTKSICVAFYQIASICTAVDILLGAIIWVI